MQRGTGLPEPSTRLTKGLGYLRGERCYLVATGVGDGPPPPSTRLLVPPEAH